MLLRAILTAVVCSTIFFSSVAQAYDLPKIKINNKNSAANIGILKSDWATFDAFKEKISNLLKKNKTLESSSAERVFSDKNLIFINFYKGNAYFLDKHSIKIINNSSEKRSWRQRIYPIGEGITAQNSKATVQNFCYIKNIYYNSLKDKNALSEMTDDADRKFLEECFKVGYYYAFNESLD